MARPSIEDPADALGYGFSVRLKPAERERLNRVARKTGHGRPTAWIRHVLLTALDEAEAEQKQQRRQKRAS